MLNSFDKLIEVIELREYQNPTYKHIKIAIVRTREAIYQLEYSCNQIVRLMMVGSYPVTELFKMYEDIENIFKMYEAMEYIRIK